MYSNFSYVLFLMICSADAEEPGRCYEAALDGFQTFHQCADVGSYFKAIPKPSWTPYCPGSYMSVTRSLSAMPDTASGLVLDFDGDAFARDADVLAKSTLPQAARQVPASIRPAVVEGMREALVEHLDDPPPFTLEGIDAGLGISPSPEMTVFIQPLQAEYLQFAREGGSRSDVVIPAKDAPVDRHGNLPHGYLRAVEASGAFG